MNEPKLFTKSAIFSFSILLSTVFGAVLFAQNLNEVGKKNKILLVILFAIIWNVTFIRFLGMIVQNSIFIYLAVNALGGLILIFPIWKQYLNDIVEYERRSILGPLILFVVLVGGFIALVYFQKQ